MSEVTMPESDSKTPGFSWREKQTNENNSLARCKAWICLFALVPWECEGLSSSQDPMGDSCTPDLQLAPITCQTGHPGTEQLQQAQQKTMRAHPHGRKGSWPCWGPAGDHRVPQEHPTEDLLDTGPTRSSRLLWGRADAGAKFLLRPVPLLCWVPDAPEPCRHLYQAPWGWSVLQRCPWAFLHVLMCLDKLFHSWRQHPLLHIHTLSCTHPSLPIISYLHTPWEFGADEKHPRPTEPRAAADKSCCTTRVCSTSGVEPHLGPTGLGEGGGFQSSQQLVLCKK